MIIIINNSGNVKCFFGVGCVKSGGIQLSKCTLGGGFSTPISPVSVGAIRGMTEIVGVLEF